MVYNKKYYDEHKEQNKKWRMKQENREKRKIWTQKHRMENLEKIKAYDRMRNLRDKVKRLAWHKKYKMENKELIKIKKAKYLRSPAGKLTNRLGKIKRREYLNQLQHNFTKRDWNMKIYKTEGICPDCNKNVGIMNLTLDHILPVSKAPRGFIYTINDVQPLCKLCNSLKGVN